MTEPKMLSYGALLKLSHYKLSGRVNLDTGDLFSDGTHSFLVDKVYPRIPGQEMKLDRVYFDVIAGDLSTWTIANKFNFTLIDLREECIVDEFVYLPFMGNYPHMLHEYYLRFKRPIL